MQYTANYNLNLPEGTDIVNPLVQDNPNYSTIDAAMYANKLRVIGTASEVTSGTVHAITRSDTDIPVFRFVATSDYNTGDTYTVDGVSVTALLPDGTTPKNKAYVINASVLAILDGTKLTFIGIDGKVDASDVDYDNSTSGMSATDSQSAIDELCYHKIADSAATGTIAQKLLSLYSAYSNLNSRQKLSAILTINNNSIFVPVNASGVFFTVFVDSNSSSEICYSLGAGTGYVSTNGVITDISALENGNTYNLWVAQ